MVTLRQTIRFIAASCLATGLVAVLAGCGTTPDTNNGNAVEVQVTSSRSVTVKGELVPIMELPARLKSMGATQQTRIMLVMAENSPSGTDQLIQQQLVRAGFPKVVRVLKLPPSASAGKSAVSPVAPVPAGTPLQTNAPTSRTSGRSGTSATKGPVRR